MEEHKGAHSRDQDCNNTLYTASGSASASETQQQQQQQQVSALNLVNIQRGGHRYYRLLLKMTPPCAPSLSCFLCVGKQLLQRTATLLHHSGADTAVQYAKYDVALYHVRLTKQQSCFQLPMIVSQNQRPKTFPMSSPGTSMQLTIEQSTPHAVAPWRP